MAQLEPKLVTTTIAGVSRNFEDRACTTNGTSVVMCPSDRKGAKSPCGAAAAGAADATVRARLAGWATMLSWRG